MAFAVPSATVPRTIGRRMTTRLFTISLVISKIIFPGLENAQSGNNKLKRLSRLISIGLPSSRSGLVALNPQAQLPLLQITVCSKRPVLLGLVLGIPSPS